MGWRQIDLAPTVVQRRIPLKDRPPEFIAELRRVFGARPGGTRHDLAFLAEQAKRRRRLPKLLLDCGRGDFLLADNRALHAELQRLRVPHTYREFAGKHNWNYWDLRIREALDFHAKNLGIPGYARRSKNAWGRKKGRV